MTACKLFQPPRTPPQCFSNNSRNVILISSSTTIGLLTWPEIPNNFVPRLLGLPNDENQDAPRRRMVGHTATVSTLVTVVGHPKRPILAGNGGFKRGLPALPE